jgi:predicted regulator of Ras-like GTPase activity (Roadblock/LC7/MglB family)
MHSEIGGEMVQLSICGPDGIAIARETILKDIEIADTITGRAIMAIQTARKATDKLKLGDYEETILTSDKTYVMSKFLGDGSYSILLSFTRKATLGTVRMILEEYAPQLWDAIPR